MVTLGLFFALGVWLLQQQAALPNLAWVALLLLPAALLFKHHRTNVTPLSHFLRFFLIAACAIMLGFFYAAFIAQQRLSEVLPEAWQGKDIEVIGVVAELPRQYERGLSFVFDVEKVLTAQAQVPRHILLSTYDDENNAVPPLHAGERWQLTVRLKRPHGTSNPNGFDFEAWMLERNLRASGYVRTKARNTLLAANTNQPGYTIERLRETVRESFQNSLHDAAYTGVLIALAIGDQGSIRQDQWQVFTRTGVNHLMSISGLHITMLASLAFFTAYHLWRRNTRLTIMLPARKAAALAGLMVALGYALLSGYSVPAQRTVYMLATVAVALLSSRNVAPIQLLAAALLVALLFDPWAVMAPGFWLSFIAVGLILHVTANRLDRLSQNKQPGFRIIHVLNGYGRVQWAMMIGLIPPLLALFQQVSLVSPIANAIAIPLVSFVVVPLTLLGAVLPFDSILQLAHHAMSMCMAVLEWLDGLPIAVWIQHAPPDWSVILGMLGVLWLLLPRGFPARWLGFMLLLPMFLVLPEPLPPNALRLTIFDVGQGLAVMAQTRQHALLYDAGPDFSGEADSGNRILLPALRAQGIGQLDGLMLSHNDSDHIGGALSLLAAMPVGWVSSSLPANDELLQHVANSQRCVAGQAWAWDGVNFEVLHPTSASYVDNKLHNNERSCVLRITTGNNSVLLTADIEKLSTQRLLKEYADKLPATLLVVPHHGSKSSSAADFVDAVHPRYAVFTAGYRNRFGHPHPEIVARYRKAGSELLRSDVDGAIVVNMDAQDVGIERWRQSHARYWQQRYAP